jgi:hypothetical protein
MTWTSTLPAAPGRYWWRAPGKYGLVLVKWKTYGSDFAPELGVVSMSFFNSYGGGECSPGEGWAYGSNIELERYPGIEIWSEPERGPEGFLPELPGKPDWTPPDPKVVEAKHKTSSAESAKRAKEEVDERAEKIAEAKEAGEILYECSQCEELYAEDDLVQVRECPHCDDERFNGSDEGQNCPTCNRRFTRNITEKGCPDCLDEECEPLAETVPAPRTLPKPKRERRA